MSEIWGSEVTLYYPGLYAGATDLVGVYDYEDSIVDFKQSNKPKRKEWIEDYFMQLGRMLWLTTVFMTQASRKELY